ncbi:hypothetical protein [Hoeflea sp.]|uniref:hypothetical protein n=1 Tax=Hoeflea sp. TaxID=1940281 RepID=UPI003A923077
MTTHLDPVRLWANVIGVVNHPMRQPQQTLLDGFQMSSGRGQGGVLLIFLNEHYHAACAGVQVISSLERLRAAVSRLRRAPMPPLFYG